MSTSLDSTPIDRKYRLLLADFDPAFCVTATTALADYGHELKVCRDGEAAWKLAGESDFDLAMIDLGVPKLNGLEFISKCRDSETLNELPIIALSDAADEGHLHQGPRSWRQHLSSQAGKPPAFVAQRLAAPAQQGEGRRDEVAEASPRHLARPQSRAGIVAGSWAGGARSRRRCEIRRRRSRRRL